MTPLQPPAAHRIEPGPGQESVWDYPRPPRVEAVADRVRVEFAGTVVVDTDRAVRVLETSHPPTYYVPMAEIDSSVVEPGRGRSFCEFKGEAAYVTLRVGERTSIDAGWTYPHPASGYEALGDMVAFYPDRVDGCWVAGERVVGQEGGFYGGWITRNVVGPFKGAPGTRGW